LPKQPKTMPLNPSGITILPDRMRALRPQVVDELAISIERDGLINPITVRPRPRGGMGYILIAGHHRLMAIRRLKRDTIEARILDGIDAVHAEILEIRENLTRADLTEAEEALHTNRLKELYEEVHPQTKHGAIGRGRKKSSQNENSFVEKTAKETGKGRSTVARAATRGKAGKKWLAQVAGTCLDQGNEIDALIKLPEKERTRLIKQALDYQKDSKKKKPSAKTTLKQLKRDANEKKLGEKQLALPNKKYGVIVADSEWDDKVWSRETGMDRHASNHYPTSDAEVIASRPVKDIAAKDCVLFSWTTNQHLRIAIGVLEAWGFEYKSHYIWRKPKISTGRWNRSVHEVLLIGTIGNPPCPAPGKQLNSVIDAPAGKHSAKPEAFLEMIEQYYQTMPKIELNRRGPPRPGWDAWGFEAEHKEAAE